MRRVLQIAALLLTAVAVVATSETLPPPDLEHQYDLVTREHAVYDVGFAYPPYEEAQVTATFRPQLVSTEQTPQAVSTMLVIAASDQVPSAAGIESVRAGGVQAGSEVAGLGRVLFVQIVDARGAAFEAQLKLPPDRPTYLTFIRVGGTSMQITGDFHSATEPCDEPEACGAMVVTDVTRDVR